MSLADVVTRYTTGTYLVKRTRRGTFDHGRYVKAAAIDLDASAADFTTNELTIAAHGLTTGVGELYVTSGGSLPAGLTPFTPYWAIAVDADHIQLASSLANANAKIPVSLIDDGTAPVHVSSSFTVDMSVQPVDGKDLKDMPEGQRIDQSVTIFSLVKLNAGPPESDPDVVIIDDDRYRVTKATKFGILSTFYKCFAERMEVP